ncbi:MAG: hypothetical protein K9K39_01150 [Desulfohalobiaceae bacterium]|nr:hypothetical protein [Desulfohalobiaceae bacterium]
MRKGNIRDIVLGTVILLCAVGLTLEYALQAQGAGSLCGTQACEVVGRYIRIGEIGLLLFGSLFFWILFGLFFFACRYERPVLWGVAVLGLIGALAFDGALLGYQFVGLGLMCWLCVAVAAGLFLVLVATAWRRASWLLLVGGIAVWCGAFAANSLLQFTPHMPSLQETAFLEQSAEAEHNGPQYYLFFSLDCPHCSEVLFNLARVAPISGTWHFAAVNRDPASRAKLAWAAKASSSEGADRGNAFLRILKSKKTEISGSTSIPKKVREATRKAGNYFRSRNFRGVPVLVVLKENGVRVSLTGVEHISRYLWEQGVVSEWARPAGGS